MTPPTSTRALCFSEYKWRNEMPDVASALLDADDGDQAMSESVPELSLPAVRTWLEGLPADEVVYPATGDPCEECVIARFVQAHGFPQGWAGPNCWFEEPLGERGRAHEFGYDLEAFIDACDEHRDEHRYLTAAEALRILSEVEQEASRA